MNRHRTIRHIIAGAALALALMPMLAGRAGAEAPGCNWAGLGFWSWKPARVAVQVDRCIAVGADPNARHENGDTPLHLAAWYGTPETVAALVAGGADLEARDKYGLTPLHAAAAHGTPETVAALLRAGANIEARSESGKTPLHGAVLRGTPETVAVLIRAGANIEARDEDGDTAADLAKDNEAVRNHTVFWTLNRARFD